MIKIEIKEYSKDGLAIRTIEVILFGIKIYKYIKTSTNQEAVSMLTVINKPKKVIGFNETKNTSKKTKYESPAS